MHIIHVHVRLIILSTAKQNKIWCQVSHRESQDKWQRPTQKPRGPQEIRSWQWKYKWGRCTDVKLKTLPVLNQLVYSLIYIKYHIYTSRFQTIISMDLTPIRKAYFLFINVCHVNIIINQYNKFVAKKLDWWGHCLFTIQHHLSQMR